MTTSERSVEEIVKEFDLKFYYEHEEKGLTYLRNDVVGYLRQTLQAERQKREDAVEAERERIISMLRNGVMTAFSEYNEYSKGYTDCQERMKEIISRELTQPNNPNICQVSNN